MLNFRLYSHKIPKKALSDQRLVNVSTSVQSVELVII